MGPWNAWNLILYILLVSIYYSSTTASSVTSEEAVKPFFSWPSSTPKRRFNSTKQAESWGRPRHQGHGNLPTSSLPQTTSTLRRPPPPTPSTQQPSETAGLETSPDGEPVPEKELAGSTARKMVKRGTRESGAQQSQPLPVSSIQVLSDLTKPYTTKITRSLSSTSEWSSQRSEATSALGQFPSKSATRSVPCSTKERIMRDRTTPSGRSWWQPRNTLQSLDAHTSTAPKPLETFESVTSPQGRLVQGTELPRSIQGVIVTRTTPQSGTRSSQHLSAYTRLVLSDITQPYDITDHISRLSTTPEWSSDTSVGTSASRQFPPDSATISVPSNNEARITREGSSTPHPTQTEFSSFQSPTPIHHSGTGQEPLTFSPASVSMESSSTSPHSTISEAAATELLSPGPSSGTQGGYSPSKVTESSGEPSSLAPEASSLPTSSLSQASSTPQSPAAATSTTPRRLETVGSTTFPQVSLVPGTAVAGSTEGTIVTGTTPEIGAHASQTLTASTIVVLSDVTEHDTADHTSSSSSRSEGSSEPSAGTSTSSQFPTERATLSAPSSTEARITKEGSSTPHPSDMVSRSSQSATSLKDPGTGQIPLTSKAGSASTESSRSSPHSMISEAAATEPISPGPLSATQSGYSPSKATESSGEPSSLGPEASSPPTSSSPQASGTPRSPPAPTSTTPRPSETLASTTFPQGSLVPGTGVAGSTEGTIVTGTAPEPGAHSSQPLTASTILVLSDITKPHITDHISRLSTTPEWSSETSLGTSASSQFPPESATLSAPSNTETQIIREGSSTPHPTQTEFSSFLSPTSIQHSETRQVPLTFSPGSVSTDSDHTITHSVISEEASTEPLSPGPSSRTQGGYSPPKATAYLDESSPFSPESMSAPTSSLVWGTGTMQSQDAPASTTQRPLGTFGSATSPQGGFAPGTQLAGSTEGPIVTGTTPEIGAHASQTLTASTIVALSDVMERDTAGHTSSSSSRSEGSSEPSAGTSTSSQFPTERATLSAPSSTEAQITKEGSSTPHPSDMVSRSSQSATSLKDPGTGQIPLTSKAGSASTESSKSSLHSMISEASATEPISPGPLSATQSGYSPSKATESSGEPSSLGPEPSSPPTSSLPQARGTPRSQDAPTSTTPRPSETLASTTFPQGSLVPGTGVAGSTEGTFVTGTASEPGEHSSQPLTASTILVLSDITEPDITDHISRLSTTPEWSSETSLGTPASSQFPPESATLSAPSNTEAQIIREGSSTPHPTQTEFSSFQSPTPIQHSGTGQEPLTFSPASVYTDSDRTSTHSVISEEASTEPLSPGPSSRTQGGYSPPKATAYLDESSPFSPESMSAPTSSLVWGTGTMQSQDAPASTTQRPLGTFGSATSPQGVFAPETQLAGSTEGPIVTGTTPEIGAHASQTLTASTIVVLSDVTEHDTADHTSSSSSRSEGSSEPSAGTSTSSQFPTERATLSAPSSTEARITKEGSSTPHPSDMVSRSSQSATSLKDPGTGQIPLTSKAGSASTESSRSSPHSMISEAAATEPISPGPLSATQSGYSPSKATESSGEPSSLGPEASSPPTSSSPQASGTPRSPPAPTSTTPRPSETLASTTFPQGSLVPGTGVAGSTEGTIVTGTAPEPGAHSSQPLTASTILVLSDITKPHITDHISRLSTTPEWSSETSLGTSASSQFPPESATLSAPSNTETQIIREGSSTPHPTQTEFSSFLSPTSIQHSETRQVPLTFSPGSVSTDSDHTITHSVISEEASTEPLSPGPSSRTQGGYSPPKATAYLDESSPFSPESMSAPTSSLVWGTGTMQSQDAPASTTQRPLGTFGSATSPQGGFAPGTQLAGSTEGPIVTGTTPEIGAHASQTLTASTIVALSDVMERDTAGHTSSSSSRSEGSSEPSAGTSTSSQFPTERATLSAPSSTEARITKEGSSTPHPSDMVSRSSQSATSLKDPGTGQIPLTSKAGSASTESSKSSLHSMISEASATEPISPGPLSATQSGYSPSKATESSGEPSSLGPEPLSPPTSSSPQARGTPRSQDAPTSTTPRPSETLASTTFPQGSLVPGTGVAGSTEGTFVTGTASEPGEHSSQPLTASTILVLSDITEPDITDHISRLSTTPEWSSETSLGTPASSQFPPESATLSAPSNTEAQIIREGSSTPHPTQTEFSSFQSPTPIQHSGTGQEPLTFSPASVYTDSDRTSTHSVISEEASTEPLSPGPSSRTQGGYSPPKATAYLDESSPFSPESMSAPTSSLVWGTGTMQSQDAPASTTQRPLGTFGSATSPQGVFAPETQLAGSTEGPIVTGTTPEIGAHASQPLTASTIVALSDVTEHDTAGHTSSSSSRSEGSSEPSAGTSTSSQFPTERATLSAPSSTEARITKEGSSTPHPSDMVSRSSQSATSLKDPGTGQIPLTSKAGSASTESSKSSLHSMISEASATEPISPGPLSATQSGYSPSKATESSGEPSSLGPEPSSPPTSSSPQARGTPRSQDAPTSTTPRPSETLASTTFPQGSLVPGTGVAGSTEGTIVTGTAPEPGEHSSQPLTASTILVLSDITEPDITDHISRLSTTPEWSSETSLGTSASSQFPPESATLSAPSNTEAQIIREGSSTPHPTQTEFSSFQSPTPIQHSGTGQEPLTFSPASVYTDSDRTSTHSVISEEASTEPLSPGPSSRTQGGYSPPKATAYLDESSPFSPESMSAPTSSLVWGTGTMQSQDAPASTTQKPLGTFGSATSPQGGFAPGTQLAGSTEGPIVTGTTPEIGAHASQPLTASTIVALSDVMERDTAGHTSSSSSRSEGSSEPSAGTSTSSQFPTERATLSAPSSTEARITKEGSSTPHPSDMVSRSSQSATSLKDPGTGQIPLTSKAGSASTESSKSSLHSIISEASATEPISPGPLSATQSGYSPSKATESSGEPSSLGPEPSSPPTSSSPQARGTPRSQDAPTSTTPRPSESLASTTFPQGSLVPGTGVAGSTEGTIVTGTAPEPGEHSSQPLTASTILVLSDITEPDITDHISRLSTTPEWSSETSLGTSALSQFPPESATLSAPSNTEAQIIREGSSTPHPTQTEFSSFQSPTPIQHSGTGQEPLTFSPASVYTDSDRTSTHSVISEEASTEPLSPGPSSRTQGGYSPPKATAYLDESSPFSPESMSAPTSSLVWGTGTMQSQDAPASTTQKPLGTFGSATSPQGGFAPGTQLAGSTEGPIVTGTTPEIGAHASQPLTASTIVALSDVMERDTAGHTSSSSSRSEGSSEPSAGTSTSSQFPTERATLSAPSSTEARITKEGSSTPHPSDMVSRSSQSATSLKDPGTGQIPLTSKAGSASTESSKSSLHSMISEASATEPISPGPLSTTQSGYSPSKATESSGEPSSLGPEPSSPPTSSSPQARGTPRSQDAPTSTTPRPSETLASTTFPQGNLVPGTGVAGSTEGTIVTGTAPEPGEHSSQPLTASTILVLSDITEPDITDHISRLSTTPEWSSETSLGTPASSQFPPESATLSAPSNTEAQIIREGSSTPHPTQTEFSSFQSPTPIQHSGTGQEPLTFSPASIYTDSDRTSTHSVISEEASTEPLSPGPSSRTQGGYSPPKATAYLDESSPFSPESMSAPTSSLVWGTGTMQSQDAPASTTQRPLGTFGSATSPQGGFAPGTQLAGSTEGPIVTGTTPEIGAHASQPLTASTIVALSDVMERDTAGHTSSSSSRSEGSSEPSAGTSTSSQFPTERATLSAPSSTEARITKEGSSTPHPSDMVSRSSQSATSLKDPGTGQIPLTSKAGSASTESSKSSLHSMISEASATEPISPGPLSTTQSGYSPSKATESSGEPSSLGPEPSSPPTSSSPQARGTPRSQDAPTSTTPRPSETLASTTFPQGNLVPGTGVAGSTEGTIVTGTAPEPGEHSSQPLTASTILVLSDITEPDITDHISRLSTTPEWSSETSLGTPASSQFPPESATLSAPSNTEAQIIREGSSTPHPTQTEFSSFQSPTPIQHSGTGQEPLTFSPASIYTDSDRTSTHSVISEEASTEPLSPGPSSRTQGGYSPPKATAYLDESSPFSPESMSAPTSSLVWGTGTMQSQDAPASTTQRPLGTFGSATSPQGGFAPGTQLAGSTEGPIVTGTTPEIGAHASQPLTASTIVALSDVTERDTAGHTSSSSSRSEGSSEPSAGTSTSSQFPTERATLSAPSSTEARITKEGSSTPHPSDMVSRSSQSATSLKDPSTGQIPLTSKAGSASTESSKSSLHSVISEASATEPISPGPLSATQSGYSPSKATESSGEPSSLGPEPSSPPTSSSPQARGTPRSQDAPTSTTPRPSETLASTTFPQGSLVPGTGVAGSTEGTIVTGTAPEPGEHSSQPLTDSTILVLSDITEPDITDHISRLSTTPEWSSETSLGTSASSQFPRESATLSAPSNTEAQIIREGSSTPHPTQTEFSSFQSPTPIQHSGTGQEPLTFSPASVYTDSDRTSTHSVISEEASTEPLSPGPSSRTQGGYSPPKATAYLDESSPFSPESMSAPTSSLVWGTGTMQSQDAPASTTQRPLGTFGSATSPQGVFAPGTQLAGSTEGPIVTGTTPEIGAHASQPLTASTIVALSDVTERDTAGHTSSSSSRSEGSSEPSAGTSTSSQFPTERATLSAPSSTEARITKEGSSTPHPSDMVSRSSQSATSLKDPGTGQIPLTSKAGSASTESSKSSLHSMISEASATEPISPGLLSATQSGYSPSKATESSGEPSSLGPEPSSPPTSSSPQARGTPRSQDAPTSTTPRPSETLASTTFPQGSLVPGTGVAGSTEGTIVTGTAPEPGEHSSQPLTASTILVLSDITEPDITDHISRLSTTPEWSSETSLGTPASSQFPPESATLSAPSNTEAQIIREGSSTPHPTQTEFSSFQSPTPIQHSGTGQEPLTFSPASVYTDSDRTSTHSVISEEASTEPLSPGPSSRTQGGYSPPKATAYLDESSPFSPESMSAPTSSLVWGTGTMQSQDAPASTTQKPLGTFGSATSPQSGFAPGTQLAGSTEGPIVTGTTPEIGAHASQPLTASTIVALSDVTERDTAGHTSSSSSRSEGSSEPSAGTSTSSQFPTERATLSAPSSTEARITKEGSSTPHPSDMVSRSSQSATSLKDPGTGQIPLTSKAGSASTESSKSSLHSVISEASATEPISPGPLSTTQSGYSPSKATESSGEPSSLGPEASSPPTSSSPQARGTPRSQDAPTSTTPRPSETLASTTFPQGSLVPGTGVAGSTEGTIVTGTAPEPGEHSSQPLTASTILVLSDITEPDITDHISRLSTTPEWSSETSLGTSASSQFPPESATLSAPSNTEAQIIREGSSAPHPTQTEFSSFQSPTPIQHSGTGQEPLTFSPASVYMDSDRTSTHSVISEEASTEPLSAGPSSRTQEGYSPPKATAYLDESSPFSPESMSAPTSSLVWGTGTMQSQDAPASTTQRPLGTFGSATSPQSGFAPGTQLAGSTEGPIVTGTTPEIGAHASQPLTASTIVALSDVMERDTEGHTSSSSSRSEGSSEPSAGTSTSSQFPTERATLSAPSSTEARITKEGSSTPHPSDMVSRSSQSATSLKDPGTGQIPLTSKAGSASTESSKSSLHSVISEASATEPISPGPLSTTQSGYSPSKATESSGEPSSLGPEPSSPPTSSSPQARGTPRSQDAPTSTTPRPSESLASTTFPQGSLVPGTGVAGSTEGTIVTGTAPEPGEHSSQPLTASTILVLSDITEPDITDHISRLSTTPEWSSETSLGTSASSQFPPESATLSAPSNTEAQIIREGSSTPHPTQTEFSSFQSPTPIQHSGTGQEPLTFSPASVYMDSDRTSTHSVISEEASTEPLSPGPSSGTQGGFSPSKVTAYSDESSPLSPKSTTFPTSSLPWATGTLQSSTTPRPWETFGSATSLQGGLAPGMQLAGSTEGTIVTRTTPESGAHSSQFLTASPIVVLPNIMTPDATDHTSSLSSTSEWSSEPSAGTSTSSQFPTDSATQSFSATSIKSTGNGDIPWTLTPDSLSMESRRTTLPSVISESAATGPVSSWPSGSTQSGMNLSKATESSPSPSPLVHLSSVESASYLSEGTSNVKSGDTATSLAPRPCSVPDFHIQLEEVTSQVIEFSWSLQNDRKDGPYMVTLMVDNRIINETITDHTRMVFRNLSPGYRYTITVEVRSCAKINTSITVWTDAIAFSGTTRITNEVYKPQYSNKSSSEFQNFQKMFVKEIRNHLPSTLRDLADSGKLGITVIDLREGSVIVAFNIKMATDQNTTYSEVEDAVTDVLRKSTALKVDPNSTSVRAIPLCELGNNYCSEYANCLSNGETASCQCRPQFEDQNPLVPGKTCTDIDECSNKMDDCSKLASCINTIGSYECHCYSSMKDMNLTNPGRMCQDPTVCFNRTDFCSLPTNKCLDTQSYICSSKQAFACRILFKNWNFIFPDLYNSESETYKNLSDRIRKTVFKGMTNKLGGDNFDIIMVGYQNGSLIAYFVLLIHGQQFIEAQNLTSDLTEVIQTMLDNQTEVIVRAISVSAIFTQKPVKEDLTWKTAIIVLGVLFGIMLIFLLVMIFVCHYMKSRSDRYDIEPQGLMGKFSYRYL